MSRVYEELKHGSDNLLEGTDIYSTDEEIQGKIQECIDRVKKYDPVNRPKHYNSHPSGVECITVTRHMTFNLGNAVKYLWRNGLKDSEPSVQELEKAVWYIKDEIVRISGGKT